MSEKKLSKEQFFKTEIEVKDILKHSTLARKSDQALFLMYWLKKAKKVPFKLFFICPSLFGGCSFKTIERVRRKIQADHPEYKDEYTAEKRMEAQQIYEQYSLNM